MTLRFSFLTHPLLACLAALLLLAAPPASAAPADQESAQTIVHMLDYVGVDYPEFVQDGKNLRAEEYEERREFATQAIALLEQLPAVPEQPLQVLALALIAGGLWVNRRRAAQ